MNDTLESIRLAEEMQGRKWVFGTGDSKLKYHNPAKDAMYNFAPYVDEDIVATKKHLRDAERDLNHRWVIDDL